VEAEPEDWRQTMLMAGLELGLEGMTDIGFGAMEGELAILREDPDLRASARRSAAANVTLLVTVLQDAVPPQELEPPPAAAAFARELARRNVPVSELGRAYRLAQHALWRWAVGEIHARISDPATVIRAVEELSDSAFETGDVFSTLATEIYATERERWVRSADAVRSATLADLLAGGVLDADVAGRRLGYELRQAHEAFVVWTRGRDTVPERVALAVAGDRGLVLPLGPGAAAGWAPAGTLDVAAAGTEAARIAIADPGSGVDGFRRGHRDAVEARRVASLGSGDEDAAAPRVVRFRDVALLALLTQDPARAREFVATTLGPLAEPDAASRRLALTLRVLLEEQGSPRRASHRLGVHENTVAKRQQAIDRRLDPATRAPVAELLAALTLHDALGPGG
jgi:hypothetical protein